MYPAPPGESEILGLEAAGTVETLSPDCTGQWKVGDRVMALLAGRFLLVIVHLMLKICDQ